MRKITFLFEMSDELEKTVFATTGKTYRDSMYEYEIDIDKMSSGQRTKLARFAQAHPEKDLHELINGNTPITLLYLEYTNCEDTTYHTIDDSDPLLFYELPDDEVIFDTLDNISNMYENEVDDCSEYTNDGDDDVNGYFRPSSHSF